MPKKPTTKKTTTKKTVATTKTKAKTKTTRATVSSNKKVVAKSVAKKPVSTTKKTNTTTVKTKKATTNKKSKTLFTYTCVPKYYKVLDLRTLKHRAKKKWFIIGDDGHKSYRKFDTKEEAIDYFRNLKKHAKMRIQSIYSNEFIKVIYSFLSLEAEQVKVKDIIKRNKSIYQAKVFQNDDEFIDELSIYDKDYDGDWVNFDNKNLDNLIAKKEDLLFYDTEQEAIVAEIVDESDDDNDFTKTKTFEVITSSSDDESDDDINDIYVKEENVTVNNIDRTTITSVEESQNNYELNDNHTRLFGISDEDESSNVDSMVNNSASDDVNLISKNKKTKSKRKLIASLSIIGSLIVALVVVLVVWLVLPKNKK